MNYQNKSKAELIKRIKELELLDVKSDLKSKRDSKEHSKRFSDIISNAATGYFFIDKTGIIRDVNKAWAKMYKYKSLKEIVESILLLFRSLKI